MVPFERALTDGVVTLRPFDPSDRTALLAGRDREFHRFMGAGSPTPTPMACICVGGGIIGWIDIDDDRPWLAEREGNVGYNMFAAHRGNGFATRALRCLCEFLEAQVPPVQPSLLIDPSNGASLAVAEGVGFEQIGRVDDQLLYRPSAVAANSAAAPKEMIVHDG